jgi:hypothetical protein
VRTHGSGVARKIRNPKSETIPKSETSNPRHKENSKSETIPKSEISNQWQGFGLDFGFRALKHFKLQIVNFEFAIFILQFAILYHVFVAGVPWLPPEEYNNNRLPGPS